MDIPQYTDERQEQQMEKPTMRESKANSEKRMKTRIKGDQFEAIEDSRQANK